MSRNIFHDMKEIKQALQICQIEISFIRERTYENKKNLVILQDSVNAM